jgi:hypothetical protein
MPAGKRVLTVFLLLIMAALLAFAAYTWLSLHWSFSEGDRAGFVQKISSKGWLCKTWEGELLLATVPGAIPERFEFSVREDAVAAQIKDSLGKRVVLHYEQHRGVPSSCFGETEYFVESVRVNQ